MFTVLGFVLFGGEEAAFFGLITAVAVVVTIVVWRFDNAWARALGVLASLGAMATMFWLAFGVFQVFSPLEFIVGLVFLLGVVLSLVGGIMTLFPSKKGDTGPTNRETRVRKGTLGLIGDGSGHLHRRISLHEGKRH